MAWSEISPGASQAWPTVAGFVDNIITEAGGNLRLENNMFLVLEGYPAPTPPTWSSVEPAPSNTWTEI